MSIWVHGRFLYNPITPIDPVKGNLKDILRTHKLNHNKEPCKGRFRQGLQSRFRNRPARLPKGSFQIDPVFLSHGGGGSPGGGKGGGGEGGGGEGGGHHGHNFA